MRLILASTSPRRRDLLSLLHLPFDIADPTFIETVRPGVPAAVQARVFAEGKAYSCVSRHPDSLIIGCDTLIAIDERILGKPNDAREAREMLERLSGRDHCVHTGLAVVAGQTRACRSGVATVRVHCKRLTPNDIDRYVASGEWAGKAGAYAIQGIGEAFIERIDGDFTAVVGLPLRLVSELLATFSITVCVEDLYRRRPYPNWSRFA